MDKFSQDALALHNFLRFKHNAPPLTLSDNLQKSAQLWAEQLLRSATLESSLHAKRGDVGENLCRKRGTAGLEGTGAANNQSAGITAKEVVDYWYTDLSKYNFKDGSGAASGFTQLVWKRTREVGFGVARNADQCVVVAHYSPPGNIIGQYQANVDSVSEVFESMKGKKKTEEMLQYLSPAGEITIKRSEKEYIDRRGNFVRSAKCVMLKGGASAAAAIGGAGASTSKKPTEKESKPRPPPVQKIEDSESESSDEDINSKKELTNFRKEVVDLHNKYRKAHSSPELKSNKELDILAQKWARKLSKMDKLVNSNDRYKNDSLGSNIAARTSNVTTDYAAKELVQYWYDAHDKYDFSNEPSAIENVGNFTQLVWKGSKEVGIGKHIHRDAKGSKAVVVCYYYPAGNIKTLFRENVSKSPK